MVVSQNVHTGLKELKGKGPCVETALGTRSYQQSQAWGSPIPELIEPRVLVGSRRRAQHLGARIPRPPAIAQERPSALAVHGLYHRRRGGVGGRGRGAPRACRESGASEDGRFTVCVARSPFSPLCSALSCAIPERCRVPAAAGERLAAAPGRATPRISAVAAAGGEAPARSNGSAVSGDGADSRRRPPSSPGFVLRALRLPPYPGPCPASRLCIR